MNKYEHGKIYKITCDTDEVYVGSTIQPLIRRFSHHKSHQMKSTKNILHNNPKIELIEEYPCNTRRELLQRERVWVDKVSNVNTERPLITKQEKLEYVKKWSKVNRDKKEECRRNWRAFKNSWGYNNYLGTSLNLLDIDPSLFV